MSLVIGVELDRVRIRAREALRPRCRNLVFGSVVRVRARFDYGRFRRLLSRIWVYFERSAVSEQSSMLPRT